MLRVFINHIFVLEFMSIHTNKDIISILLIIKAGNGRTLLNIPSTAFVTCDILGTLIISSNFSKVLIYSFMRRQCSLPILWLVACCLYSCLGFFIIHRLSIATCAFYWEKFPKLIWSAYHLLCSNWCSYLSSLRRPLRCSGLGSASW